MKIDKVIKTLIIFGTVLSFIGNPIATAAPTGGKGGELTNITNRTFTSGKYTSKYHLYAQGLDWSKPVGMLIYADGSGEYGLKNLSSNYLMAGADGLINVAKRNNMILLTPLSPNTNCADGDGSCWYMGDSVGYTKWAEELVSHIQSRYNIDKDRVAFGGYSSGAQLATEWWVPSGAAQRTMTDGVIVAISYGGSPKMTEVTYANDFKTKVHMNWNTGANDDAYTGSGPYRVKAGYDAYTSKNFKTSLDVISGLGHDRGDFGKVMEAQIKEHVPAGSITPLPTTPEPTPQPNPEPIIDPATNCPLTKSIIGSVTKDVEISTTGSYTIWTRMMKSGANDRFYMKISNSNTCTEIKSTNLPDNQWAWVGYRSGKTSDVNRFDLRSGLNKISIYGIQPGVKLDRFLIVADGSCESGPIGNGDNCIAVIDTTPPSLDVSSPDNMSTITGNTEISLYAKDETSESKVEILIDSQLIAELKPTPYAKHTWDSSAVNNGQHRLTVRAIDSSGNVSTDTRTITVQNGDTQKPSKPTGFTAKEQSGEVVLTWDASTDNVGVVSYTIVRNDKRIFTSTSLVFTDTDVLPGDSYSYHITAQDAAGNISDRSADQRVTITPAEDTEAPTQPSNLKLTAISSTQINLSWTASTDNIALAGYDIYRSVSSDAFVKVISTNSPSYSEGSLQPNTAYAYYVIARDTNSNVSDQSDTVKITTPSASTTPTTPGSDEPTTPIDQTGLIRGKVTDKARRPISGVRVTATSNGKKYSAITNKRGVYRLENVPVGRYSLTFTHDDYKHGHETVRVRVNRDAVENERLTSKSSNRTSWWNRWWR